MSIIKTMIDNSEFVAIILSVIATIISIIIFLHSRRQLYANIIAVKRLEWIQEVRTKLSEFITIYESDILKDNAKIKELRVKKFEIC